MGAGMPVGSGGGGAGQARASCPALWAAPLSMFTEPCVACLGMEGMWYLFIVACIHMSFYTCVVCWSVLSPL